MKLTKFGTLVNKTTYLFTSIRDSNISRDCAKILEIQRGGANPFRGGGTDIFWNHKMGKRDVELHRQLWVVQGANGLNCLVLEN